MRQRAAGGLGRGHGQEEGPGISLCHMSLGKAELGVRALGSHLTAAAMGWGTSCPSPQPPCPSCQVGIATALTSEAKRIQRENTLTCLAQDLLSKLSKSWPFLLPSSLLFYPFPSCTLHFRHQSNPICIHRTVHVNFYFTGCAHLSLLQLLGECLLRQRLVGTG